MSKSRFIYEQNIFICEGVFLTVFLFVMVVVAVMGHRNKNTSRVNLVLQLSLNNVKNYLIRKCLIAIKNI